MLLLVRSGDHAVLGGNAFSDAPQRRQLDLVDAIAPRIPLRQVVRSAVG
jgi:hypothetical protein